MGELRRRISTRLAWLELSHQEFAEAIGMQKSGLSRVMRADSPRVGTLWRIATGLGLTVEELTGGEAVVLLKEHPAFETGMDARQKTSAVSSWISKALGRGETT